MKYLIITEDGEPLTCDTLFEGIAESIEAGLIVVVRASDLKELLPSGSWVELNTYGDE